MTIREIFVPVFPEIGYMSQLDAALQLSDRLNAHISAVFIRPDVTMAVAAMPEMVAAGDVTLDAIERDEQAAEQKARARFNEWRGLHDLPLDSDGSCPEIRSIGWRTETGRIESVMASIGRVSDIVVLERPNGDALTERAFDAALFETSCPTLLVPEKLPSDMTQHVVIAWDRSLEAAQAVAGAMPILRAAERVSIFSLPDDQDVSAQARSLADHLAGHGIRAGYLMPEIEAGPVGTALLDAATDEHATLIVMGAYRHGRARQLLMGGVTRHVIRNAAIPVLMTH